MLIPVTQEHRTELRKKASLAMLEEQFLTADGGANSGMEFYHVLYGGLIPAVCFVGLVGNALSLVVIGRKLSQVQ